jgi:3-isopropylmalate dehydrogenase
MFLYKSEIERVSHLAFQYAQKRKKKLTLVDKANVLETSRLWRKVVQEIAAQYSDVSVDYMFVDNAAMQIILILRSLMWYSQRICLVISSVMKPAY